jgi:plasmid segregation protein ParM
LHYVFACDLIRVFNRKHKEEQEMVARKKKKYDRVVGIDLGNGLVKIRSAYKNGKPYSLILPSCFALLKDVGDSQNGDSLKLDTYLIDDIKYVWGEDITRIGKVTATYGHQNRYKTEAYLIMAKIVMTRVVRDLEIEAGEKILIVTGVPSKDTNTINEAEIAKAFLGEDGGFHEVSIGLDDRSFRIADVHVTAQALATVIGRYLDDDGTVLDEEYETMKVAVVDVGAGTSDLDIVHELRRQNGYHSVKAGFKNVYDSIRAEIQKVHPSHEVSDYKLLKAIEDAQKASKKLKKGEEVAFLYKPSKLADEVDFTKALHDGVKEVSMKIQQAIMDKWQEQTHLDEILLVGGGADFFKGYLDKVVFGITIPENNGDSNVEGYYRLGVSIAEGE